MSKHNVEIPASNVPAKGDKEYMTRKDKSLAPTESQPADKPDANRKAR